jgi:hypothetical protein
MEQVGDEGVQPLSILLSGCGLALTYILCTGENHLSHNIDQSSDPCS